MMKIAIKGHASRGKEVIQILESLGGINRMNHKGRYDTYFYYISGDDNTIAWTCVRPQHLGVFTLEEFEKDFPFKIGDKVTIIGLPDFPKIITKMVWDCDEILYSFEGLNNTWFGAKSLKKFEMKEERNITLTLDKAKEWYKKGGELKEIALQAFTEKELTEVDLPKTWEEFCTNYPMKNGECYINSCCDISMTSECIEGRDIEMDRNVCPSQKSAEAHLVMIQLEQLRDCWRQGWKPTPHQTVFAIKFAINGLGVYEYCSREFLSFKDRKTATEFLKCFKDLIEQAGDLI